MQGIKKLETVVASWYKEAPHLPVNAQDWLAKNAWWLVLIGVILGGIAILNIIFLSFFASAALVVLGGGFGVLLSIVALLAVIVFLVLGIVSLVLSAMAINPLKAGHKKGWMLLFLVALLNVLATIISFVTSLNFFGLIWGLLAAAVGAYFLFEVRSRFDESAPRTKKPVQKTAKV
jgi:hypothetical protein